MKASHARLRKSENFWVLLLNTKEPAVLTLTHTARRIRQAALHAGWLRIVWLARVPELAADRLAV